MQLTVADRRVGDAPVVTCRGRIIAGKETTALQHTLDTLSSSCAISCERSIRLAR